MATSTLKSITNISSGIYFKETDLTVVQQAAGVFAGAMIGLTEKGPAFEVMTSSSFGDRVVRMGDLNPLYPSSYYAREFLQQANNYKEVRILGLEGYNETQGFLPPPAPPNTPDPNTGIGKTFTIVYAITGATPATPTGGPYTSPLTAPMESIAAILKPRRVAFTQYGTISYVEIVPTTQRDGSTGATDDLFGVQINFTNPTLYPPITVNCSLRPGTKEYIANVFGTNPRDNTKVAGIVSPLWVDFVFPSIPRKTLATGTPAYRYPGSPASQNFLNILTGDITTQIGFTYPSQSASTITTGNPTTVSFTTPHGYINGTPVKFTGVVGGTVTNVSGVTSLNNHTWYVGNVSGTTFDLYVDSALTTPVITSGTVTNAGSVQRVFIPTWEPEVTNLGGPGSEIEYQTPITPWFVSDADTNGDVKRLFRLWSISDGDNANTEIKIEIANINPDGNLGKGSFDLLVRSFNDREDTSKTILEAFRNLTLNPKSDNYIARRIGDGETFELKSKYIFVELNETDTIPDDALPYGVEGYVNVAGLTLPDVVWTTQYDLTKPLSKQTLGLANNRTNMFQTLHTDILSFKNTANTSTSTGKGFHLNPNSNNNINSALFTVADPSIYYVSQNNTTQVTGSAKAARCNYVVAFAGGFDGFNVYSERAWGNPLSKDYEALKIALDVLSDKESLVTDFSVLVTPDLNFQDHSAAVEATLEMVTSRGDALYIPDFRYDIDPIPQNAKLDLETSNIKSNFTAIYFPWVQIEDSINKTNVWLPPSIIALATIASTATNEQVWQPPAGSLRTVTGNLVRTRKRMKIGDREILKSANINPITEFPGSGFEITESRTTQEVLSALSFVHNRLLLGYAKKALNQSLRPILHQLNNASLRNAFVNAVTPIFERIKKLNGLEEFKVTVVDQEEDRTTLYGVVEIVPLYPVERIVIEFVLRNGTLEFNQ